MYLPSNTPTLLCHTGFMVPMIPLMDTSKCLLSSMSTTNTHPRCMLTSLNIYHKERTLTYHLLQAKYPLLPNSMPPNKHNCNSSANSSKMLSLSTKQPNVELRNPPTGICLMT